MKLIGCGLAIALLAPDPVCSRAQAAETSYDVVIVGAGSGGVSAAIQAARMGASVALVEETDWIGGQSTAAAVSTMDEGFTNTDSGIYAEFIARVEAHYAALGKSMGTCYWKAKSHCFEPRVGQQVMYAMLDDARRAGAAHRLDVMLRKRVTRVLANGKTVEGVALSDGVTLHTRVLIDATEYGDVLPLSPAAYRVGKYIGADADPKGCVQWITYTAVVKKYPQGVPPELRFGHAPPGYTDAVRRKFWNSVRPDGNPKDRVLPVNWAIHNAYRGLPDSSNPENYTAEQPEKITRTVVNWFNDYPTSIGDMEPSNRKRYFCEAKLKTLQFLYFMQHDLGESRWAVANDEGYDTPYNREENSCESIPEEFKAIERNFPVMPYLRESRRLVGVHTLTAGEIRREGTPALAVTTFPDSIAIGDYAVDLHGCSNELSLEQELEHVVDRPPGSRYGRFQTPLETLIPADVDGLLVAEKNLSQSRLANGATRLQPITMLTGQAAGVLAALAASEHVAPRDVAASRVQEVLLANRSDLALPRFSDVPKDHPLWAAVQMSVLRGWLQPLAPDRFGLDETVPRKMGAGILARRAGLIHDFNVYRPAPVDKATYADVPLYHRQAAEIEALHRAGAMAGCDAGRFCPDTPMTRGEFCEALGKLLHRQVEAGEQPGIPVRRGEAALILFRER
jgi:hypothetical protein